MAISSSLALALVLSAKTEGASKAVDMFANKTLNRIARMSAKSEDYMKSGFIDVEVGRQILKPINDVFNKAVDFENKMVGVAKEVGIGVGTKAFEQLKKETLDTSVSMHDSAEGAADLAAALVAGGAARSELSALSLKADDLSKALRVSSEIAGPAFLAIRTSLKMTTDQTSAFMDKLNTSIDKFGGNAQYTFDFIARSGAPAVAGLKLSNNALIAFSNSFTLMGKNATEAETAMDMVMKSILKNDVLRNFFNKNGGGDKGLMAILERAAKSGNAELWFQQAGFRNPKDLGLLVKRMNDAKGFNTQLDFLNKNNTTGSVKKEAEDVDKSYGEQMKHFRSEMGALEITMGNGLLPAVTKLMTKLTPLINKFSDWVKNNPKLINNLMKIALLVGGLKIGMGALKIGVGAVLGPVGGLLKVTKAILTPMQTLSKLSQIEMVKNIKAIGTAFSAVTKIFMANPWILAILAIVAVVVWVVYVIVKNWSSIKAFFIKLWASVKKIFLKTWDWIKKMFLDYTPYGLIIKHWSSIVDFFAGLWDGIKNGFQKFIQWFVDKWNWIKDNIVNPMRKLLHFGFGDSTINAGQTNPAPALVPIRGGNTYSNPFTINLTGGATQKDADLVVSTMQKHFSGMMNRYNYNQARVSLK